MHRSLSYSETILDEQGQDLDLPRNYNFQGLEKFFDFSACEACKTVITVPGEDGKSKDRTCLNKLCFAERITAAREKFEEGSTDEMIEHLMKEHPDTASEALKDVVDDYFVWAKGEK